MAEYQFDDFWRGYKEPSSSEKWLIYHRDKIIKKNSSIFFADKSKIKVLEVGCGYASNLRILTKDKRFETYGIDSSKTIIDKIKGDVSRTKLADGRKIPYPSKFFDIVFSAGLIEHYTDPSHLIEEMIRVTKNGGLIVTFVPGMFTLWRAFIGLRMILNKSVFEEPYTMGKLKRAFNYETLKLIENGGNDLFSINGLSLKLFNLNLFPITKGIDSACTEMYVVHKRK
jgi:SAM-dependent methyltransferase